MKYLKLLLFLLFPACLAPSNVSKGSLQKVWYDGNQLAITGTYKNMSSTDGHSLWGSLFLSAPNTPIWGETTVKISRNGKRKLIASLCLNDSILISKKISFHKSGGKFIIGKQPGEYRMIAGPLLWTHESGNFWLGMNNDGQLFYVEKHSTAMILVIAPCMAVSTSSERVFDRVTQN